MYVGYMSTKLTKRDKSLIGLYKKTRNMAEIGRQFKVSRQRVQQILIREGITIDKSGNQGSRALSPIT